MVTTLPQATTNQSILRDVRLAPYAPGRTETKEMAERFRATLSYRGANNLKDLELLALAAASLSLGLNPYLGEIWAIPGKGLMIGRAGWVKKLDENLTARGVTWRAEYLEVREHERETLGIPKDAKLAYVCELRRSDQIAAYITELERLRAIFPDMPYDQVIAMVGHPPVVRGIGYIQATEGAPGKGEDKTGYMSWGERCKKRAFAQACKEVVSLPYNVFSEGDVVDGALMGNGFEDAPAQVTVINGEIVDNGSEPIPTPEPVTEPTAAPEEMQRDQEGQEPATESQTFPFPPDKRLCDFDKNDWQSFWPFMAKHTGLKPSQVHNTVHDALQIESAKDSTATFSQCLDAVAQYVAGAM